MAAIITLDDGRAMYGPKFGVGVMLSLIADELPDGQFK